MMGRGLTMHASLYTFTLIGLSKHADSSNTNSSIELYQTLSPRKRFGKGSGYARLGLTHHSSVSHVMAWGAQMANYSCSSLFLLLKGSCNIVSSSGLLHGEKESGQ